MAELQDNLPYGWDYRFDMLSGRPYFVNNITKVTTWDDPRHRSRPLSGTPKHMTQMNGEHIPLHNGSPDFKRNYVYPSQHSPIPAFQMPLNCPRTNALQEFKGPSRMSPITIRGNRCYENTTYMQPEPEESVAKIAAMFPTVSDSHIRLLLKKYMKSVFPQAEELIILEALTNNDNNIQKTVDTLKELGYQRRDTLKAAQQKAEAKKEMERQELESRKEEEEQPIIYVPQMKTLKEKNHLKTKFREKYANVAEHLVVIALESVDFNETKATQILDIIVQEDNDVKIKITSCEDKESDDVDGMILERSLKPLTISQSRQSLKSLLKIGDRSADKSVSSFSRVLEDDELQATGGDQMHTYKSSLLCQPKGHNPDLAKGPSDKNLIEDYMKWQGPNALNFHGKQKGLAKGPNVSLLGTRTYKPCGANAELCNGPMARFAKGSMFTQLKHAIGNESRVK